MSNQYLHFTLGPVQGFISQARRTRDFWAASFLLSWLTAKAMQAVEASGGEIVMPSIREDVLLERVNRDSGAGPNVGSLPNNFIARVPDEFDGNVPVNAVEQAWLHLAETVWENDKLENAGVAKVLWNSQIQNFWDIAWVVSKSDDAGVLAQRKNWRTYMPPESLGDKCTMMGEWQELSGADRPNPKQQQKFWDQIIKNKGLYLQEGERLCAIAYVKRRFVHVWPGMGGHEGWKLPASVPSTSYMAAVHWLEKLIEAGPETAVVELFCRKATSGERLTQIQCISSALNKQFAVPKSLADVDGRLLFDNELEQLSKGEKDKPGEITRQKAKALREVRNAMLGTVPDFNEPLSPFYAVLMMDGDSLGEIKAALAAAGKSATALPEALAVFTKTVPDVVEQHNGFLIYAGGDDVLAILPLEDALPCALECRVAYQKAFGEQQATISAAIEYAHMKLPLSMILKDAHQLLDDIAKDGAGRDAIACRVWKPGGQQQTWAMPWDIPVEKKGSNIIARATDILALVQEMVKRSEKKSDVGYSSKLIYGFRETLNAVMPDEIPEKEEDIIKLGASIKDIELDKLLETAYLSSGLLENWNDQEEGRSKLQYVQEQIKKLMPLMRVYNRQGNWNGLYSSDGALLLRFLAQKGVEQ